MSVVGVGDIDPIVIDAEGATGEDVDATADGEVFDDGLEVVADGTAAAEVGLEVIPVPRGTLARLCKATSISSTAVTWYSKAFNSTKRDKSARPSMIRLLV